MGPWFTPSSGTSKESKALAASVGSSPRSGRKWGLPLPGPLTLGLAPSSLFPPAIPTLFADYSFLGERPSGKQMFRSLFPLAFLAVLSLPSPLTPPLLFQLPCSVPGEKCLLALWVLGGSCLRGLGTVRCGLAARPLSSHQLPQAPPCGPVVRGAEQEVCRGQVPCGGGGFCLPPPTSGHVRPRPASLASATFVQHGDPLGSWTLKGGGPTN